MKLSEFVRQWNTDTVDCSKQNANAMFIPNYWKQLFDTSEELQKPDMSKNLRLSKIGMPAIHLAYDYLYKEPKLLPSVVQWHIMTGNLAECMLISKMIEAGVNIHSDQLEVQFNPNKHVRDYELNKVPGHIDLIYNDQLGHEYLIEIKAMSSTYWKSFIKQPNNHRGYLSQLSCYFDVLCDRVNGVFWLCLNKATGELQLVVLNKELYIEGLNTALTNCYHMQRLQKDSGYLSQIRPPEPLPELRGRKTKTPTGKLIIPECMRNSEWKSKIYGSDDGYYVDYKLYRALWGKLSYEQ